MCKSFLNYDPIILIAGLIMMIVMLAALSCLFFPVCASVQSRRAPDLRLGVSARQLASGSSQKHQRPGSPGICSRCVGSLPLVEVRSFSWLRISPAGVCVSCNPRCPLCSYRFMDMFPDTALVRQIQQELDDIIQQGVRNITRLIRATDPTITGPLQTQSSRRGDRNSNYVTGGRGQRSQTGSAQTMDNSLAGRLVKDGLLTSELLQQLQREWSKDRKQEVDGQSALNAEHLSDNKGQRSKKKK